MKKPQLVVFAGPNGSGKTSFSSVFRSGIAGPDLPVVNPDEIAATNGVTPLLASKVALLRRQEFMKSRADFAIETTLSGRGEMEFLQEAKRQGYELTLVYLGTALPQVNLGRVKQRVELGGHDVPSKDVLRRYHRSMANLAGAYELSDHVHIFDTTTTARRAMLVKHPEGVKYVSPRLENWLRRHLPEPFREMARQKERARELSRDRSRGGREGR